MKRLFVTVLEGDSPESAIPLLATDDPGIVGAVQRELLSRFRPKSAGPRPTQFPQSLPAPESATPGAEE
jgi:hypothetical protein